MMHPKASLLFLALAIGCATPGLARQSDVDGRWEGSIDLPEQDLNIHLEVHGVSHDPAPYLKRITVPVLGLFGDDDRVMPTSETIAGLTAGLEKAGNQHVTINVFPGAYHSLTVQQDFDGAPLRRIISHDYTDTLVDWVVAQTGR